MSGYKEPDFKERTALAAQAREKALAKLRAKPPIDPAIAEARAARQAAQEAAAAEKSRLAKLAIEEAKAAKQAAKDAAAALAAIPPPPELTEAERKALRDAKYAARKARSR
jgi:hypothetical protein